MATDADIQKLLNQAERATRKSTQFLVTGYNSLEELQTRYLDLKKKDTKDYDKYLNRQSYFIKKEDANRVAFLKAAQQEILFRKKELANWQRLLDEGQGSATQQQKIKTRMAKVSDSIGDIEREMEKQERELKKFSWKSTFNTISKKMLSAASIGAGVHGTYEAIKSQMATGIGLGLKDYFAKGFQLGLSPKDYTELVAANRQAVLASGGLAKNFDILSAGQSRYFDLIGDLAGTTKFTQEQMSLLARSGIKPAVKDVNLLGKSFERARKLAGQTGAEFNASISDIIEDENTRARLQAATTAAQRRAIIQGTAARYAENLALGMTTKQAQEAAKALNKLAGQSPLERFKQAAKIQALGGALGVGGGAEAAAILRKGQRATDEERQQLQGYLSKMSNVLGKAATGPIGAEIFATTLSDKLGLQDLLGKNSPFNTTLAQEIAPSLNQSAKSLGEVASTLKKTVKYYEKAKGAVTAPGTQVAGGLAGWLLSGGSSILGGALGGFGGGLVRGGGGKMLGGLGRLLGLGGRAAAAAAPGLEATAATAAGGIGVGGLGLAALAGGAAYGLTRVVDNAVEKATGKSISERISRWFESDAEKAFNASMATPSAPHKKQIETSKDTAHHTSKISSGIDDQLKKMDKSNELLSTIATNSQKSADFAEKQLAYMTLTDKQKKDMNVLAKLRENNRFAGTYSTTE